MQFVYLLLALLPYISVLVCLFVFHKVSEFSVSTMFMGLIGVAASVALGALAGFVILINFPQTGSTVTNGFMTGVLAVMVAVALIVGEILRYLIVTKTIKEGKSGLMTAIAYGVGFSLGEFMIFLIPALMHWGNYLKLDAALVILADVIIEISVSIAAYELISQQNFAFIAIGSLYYLSFFLSYALHGSVVLNISAKVIILIISIALLVTFFPNRKEFKI